MLAGYLPYADTIEDSDVIIISKDGVHLYQASAAGIGGGLRYWVETEDEIYRVADITALSALTYDPTQPVYKYTWHGAPMSESNIQHAVYTALDSSGKQPDYILPKNSELTKEVNDVSVPIQPVSLEVNCLPEINGNNGSTYPKSIPFDYCRDFNQLYIGWTPITVTWYDQYGTNLDSQGRDLETYIYDLSFQYNKWRRSSPLALSLSLYPSSQSTYTTEISGEDLYNDLKDAILDEWDSDTSGDGSEEQLRYTITQNQIDVGPTTNWINGLRNSSYTDGACNELLDTYLGKVGYSDDILNPDPDPGNKHATPGAVEHNYYDRRIGKYASVSTMESEATRYQSLLDAAQANWDEAYDPVENPHPGGFENYTEYENWYIAAMWTSTEGGGLGPVGNPSHDISHGLVTKEIPFIVIASCVGYYPDYELKPISGEESQDIDYPRGNYAALQGTLNFPGYGTEVPGGSAYKPSYGETANFSDSNNYWSAVPGTNIQRILRGPNICIDYKDDNGYVWEIGLFATSENYISGDELVVEGSNNFLVKLKGTEDYTFKSLSKINLDSSLTHWMYNSNYESNLGEAFVISRGEDVINIYAYNTPIAGAGEAWVNNARNVAATIIRETGLKAFKAFEGSQITVRTNIGVNTNEGFKTGLEVVDFDDVKKFEETSYIDPVTGSAMFKGTVTSDGGLVQKRLKAGTGITITRGEKEDTISSTGGGGAVDVDTILALMEKGPGITPIKDVLNNKIRIDLKHDVDVKSSSASYISIERSYKEDPQEPGTLTNEYVDEVDLKMTAIRNDIYNAGHMVKGTGGLDLTTNPGTGQVTISTDTISNITVNGEPTTKSYDSETGKYNVDLQISSGGDDYDIPLPIPDYENREVIYASTYANNGDTFTAPSDGVLYLMAHTSGVCCLPVTIGSITYNLGVRASYSSYNESGNMLPMKEGSTATFGTRYPTNGWVNTTSQSGYILWFIPYKKVNSSELETYILPSPDYDTNTEVISASTVPTRSSGNYYTWTAPVDGIIRALGNTAGYYTVEPLDNNDASVGIYYLNHVNSSGEGVQFDYLPVRKGQKYKLQRDGVNKGNIVVNAFETTSDVNALYLPYVDYDNPVLITPTADGAYHDIYDSSWDEYQPALLMDTIVGTYNFMASILYVKEGSASDLAFILQSKSAASSGLCDSSHNSIPLTSKAVYNPKYSIAASYYGSGDITLAKYVKFEPPVAPKRILYDGQNLVDSNGDVDLTFLKQLIDGLDARITALGG